MGIHYFCGVGHLARKVSGSLLSFRVIFFMVLDLAIYRKRPIPLNEKCSCLVFSLKGVKFLSYIW